jgi:hypothetical protein
MTWFSWIWADMWPNIFAPSVFTLVALLWHHRSIIKLHRKHHAKVETMLVDLNAANQVRHDEVINTIEDNNAN